MIQSLQSTPFQNSQGGEGIPDHDIAQGAASAVEHFSFLIFEFGAFKLYGLLQARQEFEGMWSKCQFSCKIDGQCAPGSAMFQAGLIDKIYCSAAAALGARVTRQEAGGRGIHVFKI